MALSTQGIGGVVVSAGDECSGPLGTLPVVIVGEDNDWAESLVPVSNLTTYPANVDYQRGEPFK